MSWWVQLIACFFAAMTFSVLFNQPWQTLVVSSLIATLGYGLFLLMGKSTTAYFCASLLIGLLCEISARLMKRAATLFISGAIVPLVPGVGLFNTMRYVVDREYGQAVNTGAATLLAICGIALAITLSSVIFSFFHSPKKRKNAA